LLFCGLYLTAAAQEKGYVYADTALLNDNAEETIPEDLFTDTAFYLRPVSVSPDTIVALKNKKAFAYLKDIENKLRTQKKDAGFTLPPKRSSPSFIDRLFNTSFLRVFLWILAAVFIVFILYKLFSTDGVFQRAAEDKLVGEKEAETKNYTKDDYGKLVQQSCRLGDYRMAVKYLFLQTLHMLGERNVIEYASDKTNDSYLREIPGGMKNDFRKLVLNFEYTWYGNLRISREVFEKIENEFIAFERKI
jgi:hypothetical protein